MTDSASTMDECEVVQAWLRNTYNIKVSPEWLSACLEWILQENQGTLLSSEDLTSQVYEQWLQSDLAEIGEPILPADLVSSDKSELISNYPLQLVSVIDIGFPLYSQKQKLQGHNNQNEEVSADKPLQPAWEPKPSRMLFLHLTDGHTQVQAMEYRPIKDLHSGLPSGLKLLVCGTVLCRRGVLFLTPESVQLLGGGEEALGESNTLRDNLERAMNANREDQGEHAKKEFSGKFIYRPVDKKLESTQKPLIKREGHSIRSQCQALPAFQSLPVKTATSTSHMQSVKQEIQFGSRSEQRNLPSIVSQDPPHMSGKSEDKEIDYDACFSDEMDLEAIDALDYTSSIDIDGEILDTTKQSSISHTSHTRSTFQNMHNSEMTTANRSNQPSCPVNISQAQIAKSGPYLEQNKVSIIQENDKHILDYDFEVCEMYHPDELDGFQLNECEIVNSSASHSSGEIVGSYSTKKTPFQNKSITSNVIQNADSKSSWTQQKLSTAKIGSFLNQEQQELASSSLKLRSSSSFLRSTSNQGQKVPTINKNNLYKTKSNPPEGVGDKCNLSPSQSKKQCKLSDMFSRMPVRNMPDQTVSVDQCIIIDDHPHPQSASLIGRSRQETVSAPRSSSQPGDFTSFNNSANAATRTQGECRHTQTETQKEGLVKLPTAFIQLFPVTSKCGDRLMVADSLPFRYLSDLHNLQFPASITVKAYIVTLMDKLDCNGGSSWSLACRINDGTSFLDVVLANSVLAELIGFTARESMIMRQKVKIDPQMKEILREGLTQCQQKLINISCLMEVEITSGTAKPVVKKLIPLSMQHVSELISRVERQLSK